MNAIVYACQVLVQWESFIFWLIFMHAIILFKLVRFLNCYCGEISGIIPSYFSRCHNLKPINKGWINARTLQQSNIDCITLKVGSKLELILNKAYCKKLDNPTAAAERPYNFPKCLTGKARAIKFPTPLYRKARNRRTKTTEVCTLGISSETKSRTEKMDVVTIEASSP